MFARILLLCSLWSYTSSGNEIRFGFIFSDTDIDVITDVQLAVNKTVVELNNDGLLQGIQLEYITFNINNLMQINNNSLVALIIGGRSPLSLQYKASLPVISFSYGLNDHPDLLHLLPSDSLLPNSIAGFVQIFNWHQVAIATQYKIKQTETLLLEMGINIIKNVTIHSNINNTFEELFDTEAHIFILNCDSSTAVEILCHAYHRGLYYPNYLWIILGGLYKVQWWTDFNSSQCNLYQLQTVLSYSIKATSIIPTFNGHLESSLFAQDAVLTLAMGLNSTLSSNDEINSTVLFKALKSTQFEGMTGFVNFTSQGKRYGSIVLFEQYRINNNSLYELNISLFDNGGFQFYDYINQSTAFPNGIPPDGKIINTINIGVTIFGCVLFAIGMFLSIMCLLFNIIFRHRKIVKLTSPNLNYTMIVGVVMFLMGLLALFIPKVLEHMPLCSIQRFFISTGHDIAFTVALVKTWRIHYIFRSPSPNKRAPKDWQLLLAVFVIVSIDLIVVASLLIPDAIIGTSKYDQAVDKESPSYRDKHGVIQLFYILNCKSTPLFLAFMYLAAIFKLVLHVIAIILAFRIRKIEVDVINDYKYTSIMVYSSTVLIVLVVIFIYVFDDYINTVAVLVGLVLFLEAVIFLGMTFVPKMVLLYKDPKGEKIFSLKSSSQANVSNEQHHGGFSNKTAHEKEESDTIDTCTTNNENEYTP